MTRSECIIRSVKENYPKLSQHEKAALVEKLMRLEAQIALIERQANSDLLTVAEQLVTVMVDSGQADKEQIKQSLALLPKLGEQVKRINSDAS